MIDIVAWQKLFLQKLNDTFTDRVWFVGLQGSYARGEATESSDLDIVLILDELSPQDIHLYNCMLNTLPHRKLLCGFLAGKNQLLNWDASDLFQFYHDTKPIQGSLEELVTVLDEEAVRRAIKLGACNVYHGCVHNMLYDKDEEVLRGLYKSASFTVQAICFMQTGKYVHHQKDLLNMTSAEDQKIVQTFLELKNGSAVRFQEMSEILFTWAKSWIEAW